MFRSSRQQVRAHRIDSAGLCWRASLFRFFQSRHSRRVRLYVRPDIADCPGDADVSNLALAHLSPGIRHSSFLSILLVISDDYHHSHGAGIWLPPRTSSVLSDYWMEASSHLPRLTLGC